MEIIYTFFIPPISPGSRVSVRMMWRTAAHHYKTSRLCSCASSVRTPFWSDIVWKPTSAPSKWVWTSASSRVSNGRERSLVHFCSLSFFTARLSTHPWCFLIDWVHRTSEISGVWRPSIWGRSSRRTVRWTLNETVIIRAMCVECMRVFRSRFVMNYGLYTLTPFWFYLLPPPEITAMNLRMRTSCEKPERPLNIGSSPTVLDYSKILSRNC